MRHSDRRAVSGPAGHRGIVGPDALVLRDRRRPRARARSGTRPRNGAYRHDAAAQRDIDIEQGIRRPVAPECDRQANLIGVGRRELMQLHVGAVVDREIFAATARCVIDCGLRRLICGRHARPADERQAPAERHLLLKQSWRTTARRHNSAAASAHSPGPGQSIAAKPSAVGPN